MKPRIIYTRQILLTAFLILSFQNTVFSQGTDISRGNQQHFYIGFSACPTQTSILNSGTLSISQLSSNRKNSIFGSFEIGYTSKFIGLSTGVGYSSYTSGLSLGTYDNKFDTIDSENENYTRLISGENITEIQKISFLNIPLVVSFQIPFSNSFGFYLQTGVNFSIPIKKSYNSTGTFTYTGYYKAYNVSITDVTYEGFLKGYENSVESGALVIKSFDPELITSAGFYLTVQNKIQISLGVLYNRMLSNISGYSSPGSFQLSSVPDQMRSIMEGSSKVTASSMGLKLSLRIFL